MSQYMHVYAIYTLQVNDYIMAGEGSDLKVQRGGRTFFCNGKGGGGKIFCVPVQGVPQFFFICATGIVQLD